jgi:proteasome activator-like protein
MTPRAHADAKSANSSISENEETVENPAELMRVSAMTTRLLEEVHGASLDAAGFRHMARIHGRAMGMVERSLSSGLRSELLSLAPPIDEGASSEAELRVAQAQLVGWLDGLMVSLEVALMARVANPASPEPALREPRGALSGDHAYL